MYPGVFSSGVQIIEEFANDIEIHLTSKTRIVIKCLFNVKGFLYISRLSHIHLFNLLLHSIAVSWRTRRASFCFLLLFVLLLSFSEPPLLFLRSDSHMLRKLAKILSPSREFDLQNMHEKLDFGQWSFLPAQRMMDFRLWSVLWKKLFVFWNISLSLQMICSCWQINVLSHIYFVVTEINLYVVLNICYYLTLFS